MSNVLDLAIHALPGVVFTALADGTVDYVNQGWCTYTGRSASDAVGSGWQSAVHLDDRSDLIERWQTILSSGKPRDIQARLLRFDGIYRWFLLRVNPLTDEHGNLDKWCGLCVDIEDYRGVTRQSAVEPELRTIIDSIPALVSIMTPAGELECVNCHNLEYMGATLEQLKKWAVTDTVHPEDLPDVIRAWMQAVRTGEPYRNEHRIRRADGTYHWFVASGLPMRDENGEIARWWVITVDIDDQKRDKALIARAFAEVVDSEDRLRNIINAVPGFVWSAAADGSVLFLNQRWCDYTGMPLSAARGDGWTASIHPCDAVELAKHWSAMLQSGNSGEYEARLRRFDGVYRWFLIRAVPQRDESGTVARWYGENTDIEDRKQAEILLAGEKRLLGMMAGGSALELILAQLCEVAEATFDGCLCSVVLIDPKQPYPLHDAVPRLLFGAAPNVPPGLMPGSEGRQVDAESCPMAMAAIYNVPVISSDLTLELRWNEWRTAALTEGLRANLSLPITSNRYNVTGIFSLLYREPIQPSPEQQNLIAQFTHLASIAIDRARSEAALKKSEAFLTKAQRLSATGTFAWRVSTDEITWSEEFYRILDVDPSVIPSFDCIYSRIHPDDISIHREMIRRQRRKGRDFEHEHRLLMPDGRLKYVHLVAHAIKNADGELEYIAALQDVTQRRVSEEALSKVRSELAHLARVASLGAVTASIAHEVNQPLAGIITNASTCLRMLGADPPNVDGARETARRTIRDGNRASEVINRLRALFSKKSVTIENVDINEAAREVIAMLLGELQRNGVMLHPEFADSLPRVKGDRVQLQQVILNLILNAIDALSKITNRSRNMLITTGLAQNSSVYLAVEDNGDGFDPSDAERLFNAFFTTKSSGMGIGLSISRSIIERHEGQLWASANDGPGATFQFSIPHVADSSATSEGEHAGNPDQNSGSDHAKEGL
ncbi:PAS domain-containing protein [Pseudomonas sp. NPDC096950]|uniref:PAS domain-containing protein n=1 Tax=Pseudomonas sp. NPDC096950 TaxID=3364485 RepID=UPI00383A925C